MKYNLRLKHVKTLFYGWYFHLSFCNMSVKLIRWLSQHLKFSENDWCHQTGWNINYNDENITIIRTLAITITGWLVVYLLLKNMNQLGLWNCQLNGKTKMFQTTNQVTIGNPMKLCTFHGIRMTPDFASRSSRILWILAWTVSFFRMFGSPQKNI